MAGYVARMKESRSALEDLTGKPTIKKPVGKPGHKWENNFRMDLKEIGLRTKNCILSPQDRDYWTAFVNLTLYLRSEIVRVIKSRRFYNFKTGLCLERGPPSLMRTIG